MLCSDDQKPEVLQIENWMFLLSMCQQVKSLWGDSKVASTQWHAENAYISLLNLCTIETHVKDIQFFEATFSEEQCHPNTLNT